MPSASLIEKCCLIGNPVAGNPTQYLVEQAFSLKGLDWRFMTFEVEPPRLADAMSGLRALGFHGIKIGRPFHEPVIPYLDELSPAASACGSVNCVTADGQKLVGDNTEGVAFLELVRQHRDPTRSGFNTAPRRGQAQFAPKTAQIEPVPGGFETASGRRALVFGAGRLARSLSLALAGTGVESVTIVSRNAEAGRKLVERIGQHASTKASYVELGAAPFELDPELAIVVNATSLGAQNPAAKLPIKVETIPSNAVVADVAYNTARTWLTQQATDRGCRVIDGVSLYVQQTALAYRAWTGDMPDTVEMREAAEEFLGI